MKEKSLNKVRFIVLIAAIISYYCVVYLLGILSVLTGAILPTAVLAVGGGIWYIIKDKNQFIRDATADLVKYVYDAIEKEEIKKTTSTDIEKEIIKNKIEKGIKFNSELTDEITIYHSTIFSLIYCIVVAILFYIFVASIITATAFPNQFIYAMFVSILSGLILGFCARRAYGTIKKIEQMQKVVSKMKSKDQDILKSIGEIVVK